MWGEDSLGGMEPGGRCSDPALWCEPGQSLSLPEPQFPDLRSGTARTCPASRSHAMGVGMITAWPPLPPAPVGQLLPLGRRSPEGAPWRTWHSRGARPKHQPVHLSPQRAADSHLVEVSPPTPFWFNWKTRPVPPPVRMCSMGGNWLDLWAQGSGAQQAKHPFVWGSQARPSTRSG